MSTLIVRKSAGLQGRVQVPGDKSISHRATLLGAIATGTTRIHGALTAEDTQNTARALMAMGVEIEGLGTPEMLIHGIGLHGLQAPKDTLDMGNSGTGMRLLMGVLAGQNFSVTLTGDASLNRRPMDRIQQPLERMGIKITGQGDRCTPPVTVHGGTPQAIEYVSPVASAQVKSAVLLAGLYTSGRTVVYEPELSRDHTERMLAGFGATVETGMVEACPWAAVYGPEELIGQDVTVPGDFSSAAFLIAAGLLCPDSKIIVENVGLNPTRSGMMNALEATGLLLHCEGQQIIAGESLGNLQAIFGNPIGPLHIEAAMVPALIDELPLLAVIASQLPGVSIISGAQELRVKESDRIALVATGLQAMGVQVEERPDGMIIHGPVNLTGAEIDAHLDHRIAMSFAVAGMLAQGVTKIHGAECIATSFPEFVPLMQSLGAQIEELL